MCQMMKFQNSIYCFPRNSMERYKIDSMSHLWKIVVAKTNRHNLNITLELNIVKMELRVPNEY